MPKVRRRSLRRVSRRNLRRVSRRSPRRGSRRSPRRVSRRALIRRRRSRKSITRGGGVNKPLEYFGIQTGRYFELPSAPILKKWLRGGSKKRRRGRKLVAKKTKKRSYKKTQKNHCMCTGH